MCSRLEPMRLLALMHHRSHSDLVAWIKFDWQQISFAFHNGLLNTACNPHTVIAFGKDYGKLVQWETAAGHCWDFVGYPCARLLLRVGLKISQFLSSMIDALLKHGLNMAPEGRNEWDKVAASSFAVQSDLIAKSVHNSRPFSAPQSFDSQRILDTIGLRLRAAEDELSQMQTDPIYIRHGT